MNDLPHVEPDICFFNNVFCDAFMTPIYKQLTGWCIQKARTFFPTQNITELRPLKHVDWTCKLASKKVIGHA